MVFPINPITHRRLLGLCDEFCPCYHGPPTDPVSCAEPDRVVLMQPLTTGADATPSWTEPDPSPPPAVWSDYYSLGGSYDEFRAADGGVRQHWQPFALALEMLGAEEIKRRWEESQDLIRQNGVTYNVYGDPRGMDRPWQLDPIPLLIAPEEGTALEAGLIQRARLLDLSLADLY